MASLGTRGGRCDHALADTITGQFKVEAIHADGPYKGVAEVEFATGTWIKRYNTERPMELLGCLHPAECEVRYRGTQCEA